MDTYDMDNNTEKILTSVLITFKLNHEAKRDIYEISA